MIDSVRHVLAGVAAAGALATFAAAQTPTIKGYAPVTVSAANYRTNFDELRRLVSSRSVVNPVAPAPLQTDAPIYFIFAPGEFFPSDVSYGDLCARLTPELARNHFINAADAQGKIVAPHGFTLVLRLSYGLRPWRVPTVRTQQIAWRHGIDPAPDNPTSLTKWGGTTAFSYRAGGNDDALAGLQPDRGAVSVTEFESTRPFHLIVVDAFDYAELQQHGPTAKRIWTTFVASPQQNGEKLSQVLETMLRAARPYFGATTAGLQVFSDPKAQVEIGDARVVEPTEPQDRR